MQLDSTRITIGVLIPTRGDRATFLNQAKYLLSKQTKQPDHVEIVDYPAEKDQIDTAKRYKKGFETLFAKGCSVVFCWEDDDWYATNYIDTMLGHWIITGKPDLFGIGNTVYYHVVSNRYLEIHHPKKASMFSTMVTARILDLDLDKSNQYLDDFIWVQMKGMINAKTWLNPRGMLPINLGIKHGTGIVAGGAHEPNSQYYTKHDHNRYLLEKITGTDFTFYQKALFAFKYRKISYSKKPFLSIITRCYKRPIGLSKNQESINQLKDQDIEQIFITDNTGVGLLEANKSFGNINGIIHGRYAWMLDDDDFVTNPDMIRELKQVAAAHDPDVIFFRMTIKNNMNGNYYPTSELCWGNKPIIARIGGSCFVVKREIYTKFIHHFAKARCGDFYFIDEVFKSGAKCYWLDVKMCETGKVSRGAPEVFNGR